MKSVRRGVHAVLYNERMQCSWVNKCKILFLLLICQQAIAQNPIITNQFTADPSARVFGDRVYFYPSHDILAEPGKGRVGWFCMEDYHVFSSVNLTDWTDHGTIVTQNKVPWVKENSYSMWAPDCIFRNGKYYFYFPSAPKDTTIAHGFTVGVAVADQPTGPFTLQKEPIRGVKGIDPNVFIDDDGQAYLYWSQGNIYGAKLKANMLELEGEVQTLGELPTQGLKEGPYMFKRNGKYFLTYPHVQNKTERLEYAMGDDPLGPFKFTGIIMDETPGCWTNHHSILPFKNQWYLFYHANDLSPAFDKARSVRIDSLSFNADGTIKKVISTLRGVGLSDARKNIQIDRYSQISVKGASVAFLDTSNKFQGWKTILDEPDAWVRYNSVQMGKNTVKKLTVKAVSAAGGTIQIKLNDAAGTMVAEVKIPQSSSWQEITTNMVKPVSGTQNLVVQLKGAGTAELDWIRFE